jgi:hypothetical protein
MFTVANNLLTSIQFRESIAQHMTAGVNVNNSFHSTNDYLSIWVRAFKKGSTYETH